MTNDMLPGVAAGRLAKFRYLLVETDSVVLRTIHGGVTEFTPGEIEILLDDAATVGRLGDPTGEEPWAAVERQAIRLGAITGTLLRRAWLKSGVPEESLLMDADVF